MAIMILIFYMYFCSSIFICPFWVQHMVIRVVVWYPMSNPQVPKCRFGRSTIAGANILMVLDTISVAIIVTYITSSISWFQISLICIRNKRTIVLLVLFAIIISIFITFISLSVLKTQSQIILGVFRESFPK